MRLKEGNKEKDIIEAAIKVFADNGYHRSKISKIAEVANVAIGSVYVYYKNKEDLLDKIFDNLWERLYTDYKNLYENTFLTPAEKLDAMTDTFFDIFTENPSLALVYVNEQNHQMKNGQQKFTEYYEKFLEQAQLLVQEGVNKDIFVDNVDIIIFRFFVFGAIRNLLQQWASEPDNFPLNKIRQNVKYLTRKGIMK
jgi:TetR/AcrR family transcriptional regulator, fatty acid metabolism regulator protein